MLKPFTEIHIVPRSGSVSELNQADDIFSFNIIAIN